MSEITQPTSVYATGAFWERMWRMSGINFIVFFFIAYAVYGYQPRLGASADIVVAFYQGDCTRILIAAVLSGMAVLNLMWFASALRTALADIGQDGWGGAAAAASAMLGALFLLLITVGAVLAYSIAGAGNQALASGLNDFAWTSVVLSSFPRAMLIMAATFGLWRGGVISNALFATGVAAIVLVLLGATTWASDGIWAPDGGYSRIISPLIGLAWVVAVSRVLLTETPAARVGW